MPAVHDLGGLGDGFCPFCFRNLWQGMRCKRRVCPGYAPTYLRDQAERLRENLAAWDGKVCLVTLTAPGRDVLPWDRRKCAPGAHKCSGRRGCRVDRWRAAEWNRDVTERLGLLLKLARERTRRRHGKAGQVVVLAYVCESQQRGVFHPHVVLGYRTAADRAALDTFRGALKEARGRHRFGIGPGSFDAGQPDRFSARDAARYVSKYLRPDGAKTSFVPLLEAVEQASSRDPATGRLKVLVRPVYVSPVLSRLTGVTMGFLRFRRFAWVRWKLAKGRRKASWARTLASHDELVDLWRRYQVLRAAWARSASPPLVIAPATDSQIPLMPSYEQLRLGFAC